MSETEQEYTYVPFAKYEQPDSRLLTENERYEPVTHTHTYMYKLSYACQQLYPLQNAFTFLANTKE